MTDKPEPDMTDRTRRALERSIRPVDPIPANAPDFERLDQLEAALIAMPRLRREIFLAVRLDAMTYDEVARITGLSAKAVERQMVRAISHIHHHLRHGEPPPPRRWWHRRRHG